LYNESSLLLQTPRDFDIRNSKFLYGDLVPMG